MKKIISTLLVCVLLLGCVLTLGSCDKILMGEYELDALVGSVKYEFKLTKVEITVEVLGQDTEFEGTYKITENEKGETEITFTFENEEKAKEYAGTFSFEKGDGFIKIGGVKYNKVED